MTNSPDVLGNGSAGGERFAGELPGMSRCDALGLPEQALLRGLLLELPAKGTFPAPGWLDHWFEAARSVLDLLYQQQAAGGQQRR